MLFISDGKSFSGGYTFIPMPTIIYSSFPFSIPASASIPQTFFSFFIISLTHFIPRDVLPAYSNALQTATAVYAVINPMSVSSVGRMRRLIYIPL